MFPEKNKEVKIEGKCGCLKRGLYQQTEKVIVRIGLKECFTFDWLFKIVVSDEFNKLRSWARGSFRPEFLYL